MRPIEGGLCSVCGERIVSAHAWVDEHGDARCGLCRRLEQPYTQAAAYGSYDGGLRDLIHMLKYEGVRPAANVLGRMLAEVLETLRPLMPKGTLIVPVPLHPNKLRQRGFNQSEVIVPHALKLISTPDAYVLLADGLERIRETQSQIGLTRHQRRENLRGAFRVKHPAQTDGRDVLLIDDVFTTGTTASECSRILRRAGASRVWVATVARTLKAEAQFASFDPEQEARAGLAAHG
jgi:ComF family protein